MVVDSKAELVDTLLNEGKSIFNHAPRQVDFTGIKEADSLLSNINTYPHIFVLDCVMVRQVNYKRAWVIPHKYPRKLEALTALFSQNKTEVHFE